MALPACLKSILSKKTVLSDAECDDMSRHLALHNNLEEKNNLYASFISAINRTFFQDLIGGFLEHEQTTVYFRILNQYASSGDSYNCFEDKKKKLKGYIYEGESLLSDLDKDAEYARCLSDNESFQRIRDRQRNIYAKKQSFERELEEVESPCRSTFFSMRDAEIQFNEQLVALQRREEKMLGQWMHNMTVILDIFKEYNVILQSRNAYNKLKEIRDQFIIIGDRFFPRGLYYKKPVFSSQSALKRMIDQIIPDEVKKKEAEAASSSSCRLL